MRATLRQQLPKLTWWLVIIEIGIILFAAVWATSHLTNMDEHFVLAGSEYEYLTSSAYTVSQAWHDYGYIPLWQPYFWNGEPLVEWGFSTVLNPFSTIPSILFGAINGLKISLVIHVIIGGVGGWVLGRMLGLGSPGRLLLGVLMVAKGSPAGLLSGGYFQLAVSQAFMPYALAAAVGIFRFPEKRYPIVLMGAAFALIWWVGNIYYVMPTALIVLVFVLVYAFTIERDEQKRVRIVIDRHVLLRFAVAVGFSFVLSAAVVLPTLLQSHLTKGHEPMLLAEWESWHRDLYRVTEQYFNGSRELYDLGLAPDLPYYFYAYTIPAWFAALIFIVIPPIRRLHRESFEDSRRFWITALILIVFFTLWAASLNPLITWLSTTIAPILGRWRFVGRMLAIGSLLIATLAAMRADGLWRAFVIERTAYDLPVLRRLKSLPSAVTPIMGALVIVMGVGAADVLGTTWKSFTELAGFQVNTGDECIRSIRELNPNSEISILFGFYVDAYAHLQERARLNFVGNGIYPLGQESTLFPGNLAEPQAAQFGMAFTPPERVYMQEIGYQPLQGSYLVPEGIPCGYVNPNALPYAFTLPLNDLRAYGSQGEPPYALPVEVVTPLAPLSRVYDNIWLSVTAQPDQELVVVAHETTYTGWQVEIDGQRAQLESVGGIVGVIVPPGSGERVIHFYYRPALLVFSMWLTLIAAVVGAGYLLNLEYMFLPKARREALKAQQERIGVPAQVDWRAIRARTAAFIKKMGEAIPEPQEVEASVARLVSKRSMPPSDAVTAAESETEHETELVEVTHEAAPETVSAETPAVMPVEQEKVVSADVPPRERITLRQRVGALLAVVAVLLFIWAAVEFRPGYIEGPPYTTPVVIMIAGALMLGAAIFVSAKREPIAMPQDVTITPSKIDWRWTLLGFALLLLDAEISGKLLKIEFLLVVSIHIQYALWMAGLGFFAYGMAGAPRLRIPRYDPRHVAALALILILAFALRAFGLGDTVWQSIDEIHWMNGVQMIKWEHDAYNLFVSPSGFQGITGVYTYWNAGTVALFGTNWVGLRMVNAIIGAFTVLAMYGLGRALFDRRMALIAALVLATFPPHIHFSRISMAHITDGFVGVALIMFVVRGMRWGRRSDWVLAGVTLGLSQYFFESGRLLFPVLAVAWFFGMILFTPKARQHVRGMALVLIVAAVLAVPVYYTIVVRGDTGFARMGHSSSVNVDWVPLFRDGIQEGDLGQAANWALTPFLFYVHGRENPDFWGGPYSLLHPAIVPLFLLGVFYCVWRLRSPTNVLPLYVIATGLGSSLMTEKWGSPRFIIVMPIMALLIAIGIRYGLALMIPGETFKKVKQRLASPNEWRIPITAGRALMGLVIAVVIFHPYYYYGEHLRVFNARLLSSRAYPDMYDAVERSLAYDAATTQVYLISTFRADFNVARGMHDFFVWDEHPYVLETISASEFTQEFIAALPRDRNYLFMIEPGLNRVVADLVAAFPTMYPPEPSERDLPPNKQFWAYYAPMEGAR